MTEGDPARQDDAAGTVVCDVSHLTHPDAGTVDGLARLQLAARRCGCQLRLDGSGPELRRLIALAGLDEVLWSGSGLQDRRETEQGEQPGRVEELGEPADPSV